MGSVPQVLWFRLAFYFFFSRNVLGKKPRQLNFRGNMGWLCQFGLHTNQAKEKESIKPYIIPYLNLALHFLQLLGT